MLSIIIVSYNTRELLRQCLRSLAAHCPEAEVIVVDNASRDGSPDMVRDEFPGVRLSVLAANAGFAGANNVGLRQARGDFILLLNSDTYVEDDSLSRCVAWMEAQPRVGACSPRLVGFDGVPQAWARPFPCFRSALRQALWLGPGPGARSWLIGAALLVRRTALEQAGAFLDTGYFMYWEDTDLSARLLRAGWELAGFPDGHVRHKGGGSSQGADGDQRPELYASFLRGKYRWFARYRSAWEARGIWLLDALEATRKCLRGILRPGRRCEFRRARTLAGVLWDVLRRPDRTARTCPG